MCPTKIRSSKSSAVLKHFSSFHKKCRFLGDNISRLRKGSDKHRETRSWTTDNGRKELEIGSRIIAGPWNLNPKLGEHRSPSPPFCADANARFSCRARSKCDLLTLVRARGEEAIFILYNDLFMQREIISSAERQVALFLWRREKCGSVNWRRFYL